MNEQKAPVTLTVKEVQEILKIGTNSVYSLIHSKSFPVRRVGHSYRIPAEPFYEWLAGCPAGNSSMNANDRKKRLLLNPDE